MILTLGVIIGAKSGTSSCHTHVGRRDAPQLVDAEHDGPWYTLLRTRAFDTLDFRRSMAEPCSPLLEQDSRTAL
jgi:hypothetical protein